MKKRILKIIPLLIIIINLCSNVCYATENKKNFVAYKQISAFKIQLGDGSTLIDTTAKNGTEVTIEDKVKDMDIVFVLDRSGSMSYNHRLTTLKTATRQLINKIKEQYAKKCDNIEIGIVTFSDGIDDVLELENIIELTKLKDENDIQSSDLEVFFKNMTHEGGTSMYGALEKAKEMLDSVNDDDRFKMIITLTDGDIFDGESVIPYMKDTIHSENSNIYTVSIFVDKSVPTDFKTIEEVAEGMHTNYETSSSDMVDTISNKLFDLISKRIIDITEPSVSFNVNQDYVGILDNQVITQVDTEIIHGATLYIEYVLSATATFNTNDVYFIDMLNNSLQYNGNQKLLTENKTNNENGWKYDNESGYIWQHAGNKIEAGTEYSKKIVLSTVLTAETLNNTATYSNEGYAILKNSKGEEITKKLKAFDFYIIPPTGNSIKKSANTICIIIITVNLIILLCVFISKKYIRRK